MPDITMCSGDECPLKDICYRHTAKPDEHRQSYFVTVPWRSVDLGCEYFWGNGKSLVPSVQPCTQPGETS